MKQLSLLFVLCCLLGGAARAATVSGTVTNASTSLPISGQRVYIYDSLYSYRDSTLTNASGAYSFTLPSIVTPGDALFLAVYACGASNGYSYFFGGASVTHNFSVCGSVTPPATYTLHGTISLGGTANNGLATVYLIRQSYDSILMANTLMAIDSITTASTGGTYTKTYTSIPYGRLLLKAVLLPSHPSYASYLPTYYTSALVWSSATALGTSNFSSTTATNITMTAGTNPGGPGFIGGSVLLGANKSAAVGDPLNNRLLLLTKSTGEAVAYTYSNTSGHFQFPSLPYGSYKLFGDAWGKTNPALTVTLSAASASVSNITFDENSVTFAGRIGNLSVGTSSALNNVNVYPNPVTDVVKFSGLNAVNGSKTIVLSDVTGAVISRQSVAQGGASDITTATLPSGIYMLRVQTEEGTASFKIVK